MENKPKQLKKETFDLFQSQKGVSLLDEVSDNGKNSVPNLAEF